MDCSCICPCGSVEMAKSVRDKHGHRTKCRTCWAAYVKSRVAAVPGRDQAVRERSARWYAENSGKAKARDKAKRDADLDDARRREAVIRETNRDKLRSQARARYAADPDRHQAHNKKWAQANPDKVRTRGRAVVSRRRARLAGATCEPATTTEIRALLERDCMACGAPGQHVDHVLPIARGGCGSLRNLQTLCATCNHRKNAKTMIEWLGVVDYTAWVARGGIEPDCHTY